MKSTLQRENIPMNDRAGRQEYVAPEVNIFESTDGYYLEADMPGVNTDGLEITLEDNELTILGHRKVEPANGQPLVRECQNADFRRVFELDPAIDADRLSAKIEQGVLTLSLPKSERVKPRRITVD